MTIASLSLSDSIACIHCLTICVQSLQFRDNFSLISEDWNTGLICRLIHGISVFSRLHTCEIVLVLSVDRYRMVVFPLKEVTKPRSRFL